MQNHTQTTTADLPNDAAGGSAGAVGQLQPINPLTLATLDFGLFLSLRRLGTGRERICSALGLSYSEFDYINTLAG